MKVKETNSGYRGVVSGSAPLREKEVPLTEQQLAIAI